MIRKRSLFSYILFSIITCGIYSIYFWYVFTEDINRVCEGDGETSPNYIIVILLSIITCGIYMWYWLYKQGNRLQAAGQKYGVHFVENGSTILLWMLFGALICGIGPLIAYNIMFKNMNTLSDLYTSNRY